MSETTWATTTPLAPRRRASRAKAHADIDSPLTWIAARLSLAGVGARSSRALAVGRKAAAQQAALAALDEAGLEDARRELALRLRARAPSPADQTRALAMAGETARRRLGLTPFEPQYACASALLSGAVAEMETGEGKTLAAFLAAAVFALSGRSVHVVTANDYLAGRDAAELGPAYAGLGLSVGVGGGAAPAERRAAYQAHVVYISSKEVAFDYLRDRLARATLPANADLAAKLDRALGVERGEAAQLLQRSLDVAIIDEIDSVLIDEAVTPLLISTEQAGDIGDEVARRAMALAETFTQGRDFVRDAFDYVPQLTQEGVNRLERAAEGWDGPWRVRLIREELIRAALAARHALERDRHYLVRDGKIVLIDPLSGRPTPDRHWGHGLSLMVETKEGLTATGEKKSLASVSFQRFFRQYARVCGMSGTVREVADELYAVYGLKLARIPRRLPLRRRREPGRIFARREELWPEAAERARAFQSSGQPALVAVRSVLEAERASAALTAAGVAHRVLSAAQDGAEAEIVARAGERGAVTVVTNMAGRGTDIRLQEGVAELGGLAVFVCERHDSRRVDRQLIGRCARQGDPGLVVEWATRQDSVLQVLSPRWRRALAIWPRAIWRGITMAQKIGDARGLKARLQLLRRDEFLARMLAFAGGLD